jgi:hypothetical protein
MKPPASSTDKGQSDDDDSTRSDAAATQLRIMPISGIITRGSAPVTDGMREAAEVLSKLIFGDDEARSRNRVAETPPREEDSNIPLRGAARESLTLDDPLATSLAKVDYSRIDKLKSSSASR